MISFCTAGERSRGDAVSVTREPAVVFLMLSLAMLGSALPITGGNYKYASRMFSPRAAFTGV